MFTPQFAPTEKRVRFGPDTPRAEVAAAVNAALVAADGGRALNATALRLRWKVTIII